MTNRSGFILLLSFAFMLVLAGLAAGLLFMATYETRDMGAQVEDYKLFNLAEAGVQRALRAIRDDYLTTTQTGTADLRGFDATTFSVSIATPDNMRYIDTLTAAINANTDQAILSTFDANYTNTRIILVELHARASRGTSGSGNPIMQVSYTTNGSSYTTAITQTLTSTSLTDFSANITGSLSWPVIMSSNFRLRVMRTAGGQNINLDSLYLRVSYEIDTNTESWYTGGYTSFPISLGSGTIQSVSITAEQGKAHLNTASQALLRYLMEERGVLSATANTLATNIVSYRASKPFDLVEELQQVSAMTSAVYGLIKDYVTVYSYINTSATRPSGSRAPININTASREVLEAIFDPLGLGATDAASLAADIINARAAVPFTCFYSSNSAVTTDFYDFVNSRGYLTAAERNFVLDNADASSLVPVSGAASFNAVTTEFCYDVSSFKVESLADIGGRRLRLKTVLGDDGRKAFTTYSGDTTSTGYRKENFE